MSSPDRSELETEQRHPDTEDLDRMDTGSFVDLMISENRAAVEAVREAREELTAVVQTAADTLKRGGRIFYVGAGTSGRLGVLDASECPPTFSTDPDRVQGVIAGGPEALVSSREGNEDHPEDGADDLRTKSVDEKDLVIGITTGGTTPYVKGALEEADRRNAETVLMTCVDPSNATMDADVTLHVPTGPEPLTGSTRLKAGTATKVALNIISTGAMIRCGKVFSNYMVDLTVGSEKLRDRAVRIITDLTERNYEEASTLLDRADGRVKVALVMDRLNTSASEAASRLEEADGHLRAVLHQTSGPDSTD